LRRVNHHKIKRHNGQGRLGHDRGAPVPEDLTDRPILKMLEDNDEGDE
jgi:hypothetical protein